MIKSIFFFWAPQQVLKQRVIQVWNRDDKAIFLQIILTYINSNVALWHMNLQLWCWRSGGGRGRGWWRMMTSANYVFCMVKHCVESEPHEVCMFIYMILKEIKKRKRWILIEVLGLCLGGVENRIFSFKWLLIYRGSICVHVMSDIWFVASDILVLDFLSLLISGGSFN